MTTHAPVELPAAVAVDGRTGARPHRTSTRRVHAHVGRDRSRARCSPSVDSRDWCSSGGKRLRPAFCYWGFRAAGGQPDDPAVVDAGAAFELLHAFALIHDDVMDGSALRRGATTVHVEFAETTRRRRRGAESHDGSVTASPSSPATSHRSWPTNCSPVRRADAFTIWNRLRLEVNIGQYLDVLGAAERTTDLERARQIARYKSGKYTVERPLHLGAALAGGLDDLATALSAYGEPLGEAFQLRDDLLGVFGDPAVTGKPVGDDLREGKPTPLLVIAQQRAGGADARLLDRVGLPDLDDNDVEALREVFERCGARRAVERSIEDLTAEAVTSLNDPRDPRPRSRAPGSIGALRGDPGPLTSAPGRSADLPCQDPENGGVPA